MLEECGNSLTLCNLSSSLCFLTFPSCSPPKTAELALNDPCCVGASYFTCAVVAIHQDATLTRMRATAMVTWPCRATNITTHTAIDGQSLIVPLRSLIKRSIVSWVHTLQTLPSHPKQPVLYNHNQSHSVMRRTYLSAKMA